MGYLTAYADLTNGYVYLETNWADTPEVEYVRVVRVDPDGNETVVRVHTATDSTGDYIRLAGGSAVLYDAEVPLDTAVTFRAEALETGATATAGPVTVTSSNLVWLKDPLYPGHNQQLLFQLPGDPACLPGNGIFFVGVGQWTRPGRGELSVLPTQSFPLPTVRHRGAITGTLNVVTRTFDDRDDMVELLDPGTVLLLQVPDGYGIGEAYIHIPADAAEARPFSDHRRPWRIFEMPYAEVDQPAGLAYGVLGSRWMDVCDTYATFADAETAGLEWRSAMQGAAGSGGVVDGWRTWADVNSDFATWTAVNSGGRTWTDLLEGD